MVSVEDEPAPPIGLEEGRFYLSEQSAMGQEGNDMEAATILEKPGQTIWDYDEDVDTGVLCLSVGDPQMAMGLDIGEGVVLR